MASIFDLFTDPLGYKGINKQRKAADAFARKAYDPNVYSPMVEEARYRATQGVDDTSMRNEYLRRTFAQTPQRNAAMFGGNQAAAISSQVASNASLANVQAGAELGIGIQEQQAKDAGRASLAELFSKQKQTQATQESAIEQNKMVAQGEKNRRFNELIGNGLSLGASILTGDADTLAAKGLMSLFGGKAAEAVTETAEQVGETPIDAVINKDLGFGRTIAEDNFKPLGGLDIDKSLGTKTFDMSMDTKAMNDRLFYDWDSTPRVDVLGDPEKSVNVFEGGGDSVNVTPVELPNTVQETGADPYTTYYARLRGLGMNETIADEKAKSFLNIPNFDFDKWMNNEYAPKREPNIFKTFGNWIGTRGSN